MKETNKNLKPSKNCFNFYINL